MQSVCGDYSGTARRIAKEEKEWRTCRNRKLVSYRPLARIFTRRARSDPLALRSIALFLRSFSSLHSCFLHRCSIGCSRFPLQPSSPPALQPVLLRVARRRAVQEGKERKKNERQQAIDAFDAACEQDTAQRLANAEAQRYGEAPVVLPEKPKNPWDQPVGSGDAIQQWRDAFVCLRVVGKNVWGDLPAPPSAARDDFAAYAPTPPADRRPLPATTRLPLDMMAPPSKRTPTLSGGSFGALPKRPPRE